MIMQPIDIVKRKNIHTTKQGVKLVPVILPVPGSYLNIPLEQKEQIAPRQNKLPYVL